MKIIIFNPNKFIMLTLTFMLFLSLMLPAISEKDSKSTDIEHLLKASEDFLKDNNIKKSLEYAKKANELSVINDNSKYQIKALFLITDILTKDYKYNEALTYVKSIFKIKNIPDEVRFDAYYKVGNIYSDSESTAKAILNYKESLELMNNIKNDYKKVNLLMNIGTEYGILENYKTSLEYYFKASDILNVSKNSDQLTSLYNNIGATYSELGDIDNSIIYHKKAYKLAIKEKNKMGQIYALNNIAETLYDLNNFNESLNEFNKSLLISKSINDMESIAYCLIGIASCNFKLNHLDLAKKNTEEALAKSKKISYLTGIFDSNLLLSRIYLK